MFNKIEFIYRRYIVGIPGREISVYGILAVIATIIFGVIGIIPLSTLFVSNIIHLNTLMRQNDQLSILVDENNEQLSALENTNYATSKLLFYGATELNGEVPENFFLTKIGEIALRYGIFLTNYMVKEKEMPKKIQVNFIGDINQYGPFINEVENSKYLFNIISINVNNTEESGAQAIIEFQIHKIEERKL